MRRFLALLAFAPVCVAGCAGSPTEPVATTAGNTREPAVSEPPDAPGPSAQDDSYRTSVHPGAGVAFDLAKGWQLSGQESGTLLAASPDGQAVLMLHVAEPETLQSALAAVQETLTHEVKDAYFGPVTEKKLGKLTVEYASGAGKLGGRPVELAQLLVATPTGKVLVVIAVIEAAAPRASKRQARHTLESIRPHP